MERAAHHRAEVAPAVAQRVRVRDSGGRALRQLGQAADAEEAEHRADREAPGSAPVTALLVAPPRRGTAVEQQRAPGAHGDQREEDAGPAGEQRQPAVGPVPDRAELLAPQRQRQQDAERDEPDRPQVPCLDPPERRPLRATAPGAARWAREAGLLGGGTGRRPRRGAAGLGHHSEAETTA